MKLTKLAAFALAVAATSAIGNAQAAVITFQTGQSFAGTQATAEKCLMTTQRHSESVIRACPMRQ